mgnify:CR=1 FL=1
MLARTSSRLASSSRPVLAALGDGLQVGPIGGRLFGRGLAVVVGLLARLALHPVANRDKLVHDAGVVSDFDTGQRLDFSDQAIHARPSHDFTFHRFLLLKRSTIDLQLLGINEAGIVHEPDADQLLKMQRPLVLPSRRRQVAILLVLDEL